jgi:ATP-dependent Clp protease ATP-binding subunit ClpA
MTVEANHQEAHLIALRAVEIAREHKHEMATLEHVLIALLENPEVQSCLTALSVDVKSLSDSMYGFLTGDFIASSVRPGTPVKTAAFETLFIRTIATSVFSSRKVVSSLDILMNMLQFSHEDSFAITALLRADLTSLKIKRYLAHGTSPRPDVQSQVMGQDGLPMQSDTEPNNREEAINYLKKYATNLNENATSGKIDPIIGRATELDQTAQVLARRTKNNCIYVGDPGVGKSALAEGLAYNIVHGHVPDLLKKATVWSLDIGALVAGTRFRGDFEERMKLVLKSLIFLSEPLPDSDPKSPDLSVLFIDEIHTIMEAGSGSRGSLDVSNMLKPALAKGTLRCIGATTIEEYRKHFEKDRALVRRFKKVQIDEPSPELTKAILRGLRKLYEGHHHITYTDEALDAAVDLTHRYVHSALLPDKAIDIIDQAGARQRITPEENRISLIGVHEIEAEVAKIAHIPPKEMAESDASKLQRLRSDLESAVYGQTKALEILTDSVMIARAGLRELNLPAGSYLFTGGTGTGKTECARQLASTLGIPLIKFDMSEYMEKHAVSKLIGAPPGYVGFGDGAAGDGLLVNAIDTTPACVLLLDEIEKAHEDMFNILLQVMDDAKLTNSQGKTVRFNDVILIMTSNAGVASSEVSAIGFGRENDVGEIDHKAIQRLFKPEFRNRLDAIVPFDRLKPEIMIKIVDKFLQKLNLLTGLKNVKIDVTNPAREWLAKKGYDPVYGARPLTRVIDENIKKPLSREILFGNLKNGGIAKVHLTNGQLVIKGESA